MYRFFGNFAKSFVLSCLLKFDNIKKPPLSHLKFIQATILKKLLLSQGTNVSLAAVDG